MTGESADDFTTLLLIYLWRNEPEMATSGNWFWPFEDRVLDTVGAYRN